MSGIFQHGFCITLQFFYVPLPCRTVQHSRLTEPASAYTSPLDLKHNTILGRFDIRYNRTHRIYRVGHIHHNLFFYRFRRMRIDCTKITKRSVLFIRSFVELRHINTLHACCHFQKFQAALFFFFALLIEIQEFIVYGLALADIEQIEKFCQRFRIVRARTATDHDRIFLGSLFGMHRDLAQFQHL
ncbi:unknown [Lachnospiraceae bacterium CAG:215]|nr:unknown [Lachnospiraceae bacterium CAG:215]